MSAVPGTQVPEPAPVPEAAPVTAAAARWSVVPDASQARFHVRDKLVTTVHGTMPVEDGGIVVSDTGDVTGAWVTVSVGGVATGNAHRDRDLRKARFLDAERFPAVTITVGTANRTADRYTAEGTVLAKGVAVPVDLVAVLVDGSASASQIRVRVTGTLDRRPLSIKAPTVLIGRYVELEADLTFCRAPAV
jgi:polyisoprenoid-binding protein YceI